MPWKCLAFDSRQNSMGNSDAFYRDIVRCLHTGYSPGFEVFARCGKKTNRE